MLLPMRSTLFTFTWLKLFGLFASLLVNVLFSDNNAASVRKVVMSVAFDVELVCNAFTCSCKAALGSVLFKDRVRKTMVCLQRAI